MQQQPRAQEHPTPLEEQPPHPQPEVPCWTDLPPEIVSLVYQALPKEFSACLPLMQTCKAFRQVGCTLRTGSQQHTRGAAVLTGAAWCLANPHWRAHDPLAGVHIPSVCVRL